MEFCSFIYRVLFSLVLAACFLFGSLESRSHLAEVDNVQQQAAASLFRLFGSRFEVPSLLKPRKGLHHLRSIFSRIMAANEIRQRYPTIESTDKIHLFQGDIVMTRRMRKALRHSETDSIVLPQRKRRGRGRGHRRGKRAAVANQMDTWPRDSRGEVQVPYVIEASSVPAQAVIESAMNHWTSNVPCIKFVKRTTQQDYISFFAGVGCYSQVGRIGRKQSISVGPGCEHMGVIAHEIGHALGFWHEQARPDRDQYVKILWENIQTGKEGDFKKILGGAIDSRGVGYDLQSLMHYGPQAFANAPGVNTIVKRDGSSDFGQRDGLSPMDIEQAKRMYCTKNGCQHINQDQYCPGWAAAGYCTSGSWQDYVSQNCKRSCLCNVCEDYNVNCASYATAGHCTNTQYQSYMAAYCKKSCSLCN